MVEKVVFTENVPDGTYTGKWFRYDVTIEVDGKEVVGKYPSGTTGEFFDYCVVEVHGNSGILRRAT